jgi:hypothetical protein
VEQLSLRIVDLDKEVRLRGMVMSERLWKKMGQGKPFALASQMVHFGILRQTDF